MITDNLIRQIKRLRPHSQYAVVFEKPLTRGELFEIQKQLTKVKAQVLLISGARVVELDKAVIVAEPASGISVRPPVKAESELH